MAYSYRATLTVDNTKVSGAGNLSSFPVLVSGTYDGTGGEPDLRVAGSGGHIQNVDTTATISGVNDAPADLAFYDDTSQTTKYDHEVEYYDKTTGVFVAHVRIPTLNGSSDTLFYMFYGDASVTASQENITGVWDSNYKLVMHMAQDPSGSAPQMLDSTSTPLHGTTHGTMVSGDSVAFNVGNGIEFEKSKSQYVDTAYGAKIDITGDVTLEGWVNLTSFASQDAVILAHGNGAAYWQWILYCRNDTGKAVFLNSNGGTATSTTTLSTATKYYIVGARVSNSGDIFINGTSENTDTSFNSPTARGEGVVIGFNTLTHYADGKYDEIRISNTGRSADWIMTTFNTLNAPSTFYSMGSEVSLGGGTPVPNTNLTTNKFFGS